MQAVQGRTGARPVQWRRLIQRVLRKAGGYKLAIQRPVGQRLTVA